MRILWADDQSGVVSTFLPLLKASGHEVKHEPDGERALAQLISSSFDVVLADLAMPPGRWGGLWLLREIRRRHLGISVIVLSGEGSQVETIEALRLGAADYVTKERLDLELLDRIEEIARRGAKKEEDETASVRKTINAGESSTVEFKSTFRWNLKANKVDPCIELSALKTIAAFLNSEGGTLLIGVSDEGIVRGIDVDGFANEDKFQLHFWNRVREALGPSSASFISARIVVLDAMRVFVISCLKSRRPVYLKWKVEGEGRVSDLFFIRTGPRTEKLELRDAVRYIDDNFKTC